MFIECFSRNVLAAGFHFVTHFTRQVHACTCVVSGHVLGGLASKIRSNKQA